MDGGKNETLTTWGRQAGIPYIHFLPLTIIRLRGVFFDKRAVSFRAFFYSYIFCAKI